jgi:hypothetical protein
MNLVRRITAKLAPMVAVLAVVLALGATPAKADLVGTLSLTGCGTLGTGCPDATYDFTISGNSATLTITITGAVDSTNNLIVGVELGPGFTSGGQTFSTITVSEDNGDPWLPFQGPLSNNGCGDNSNVTSLCATGQTELVQGQSYTWTWTFDPSVTLVDDPSVVHIGANYDGTGCINSQNGCNGLIVSQTGATAVPEPASIALFGSGLMTLAGMIRRRRKLGK